MDNQEKNLELLASDFRQKNGLNQSEAIRLKSVLLRNNILTVYLPLSADFSGMAVKVNGDTEKKLFILVNCNHTIGRQHFSICHELYHLYYQSDFKSEKSISGTFNKRGNPEEYNADIFASYLLLPESGIYQIVPQAEWQKNKITLRTILEIEQYYSCSRSALLHRLLGMKLIDERLFSQFSSDVIKNAKLNGFNIDLYLAGNKGVVIGNYGIKARELFDKGEVSESSYFSLLEDLGVDLTDIDNQSDNE